MALWERSMRLQGPLLEQMKSLYGPKMPIEVRHYLSNWIESQQWSDVEPDNPAHQIEGQRLFEGMLQALKDLITTYATNFITRTQLEALYAHMRNEYISQPLELVRVVQNCLFREAELVDQQEQLSMGGLLSPLPVEVNQLLIDLNWKWRQKHFPFPDNLMLHKQIEGLSNSSALLVQQPTSKSTQIQQLLQNVLGRTEAMEQMFRSLSSKLENFMLQYQESYQIETAFRQGNRIPPEQVSKYRERKQLLDQILRKEAEDMKRTCTDLSQRFMDCLEQTRLTQDLVVNHELVNWKQSQRMFSWEDDRGKVELTTIQRWFEALAEMIWRNRLLGKQFELLKTRIPQGILQGDQFTPISQAITKQLIELVQASFVLEKQPPQVIKTANRFSANIRLLVGGKLQIHLGVPEVTVTIINDKQAKAVAADPNKPKQPKVWTLVPDDDHERGEMYIFALEHCAAKSLTNDTILCQDYNVIPHTFASGEILNNQKAMEYNSQTGNLSCTFNFMQLRKIKRNSDKKATEMVTEEKFTLLFRTHFTIGGGEMEIAVKTESLPVVVIVHVTQQPPAEATIFWDNSFAEANREPFVVPESVAWPRLSEALNCFFHANCGRGLARENLDYLGRKLLGIGPEEDLNQMSVSRQQLCKDQLRGRNFTFWEWFYKHLDLIKSTLKREWMEGSIQGFMQKSDAERLLLQCPPGTFLIRFSEGEPGGASVAWVTEGDVLGNDRQVLSLAPWNKHDLSIRPFADRLHDLTHLLILYPNKPKDDVFGKYYAPPSETPKDGYIPADLKATIPMPRHHFTSNPASPAPSIVSMTSTPMSPWGANINGLGDLPSLGLDFTAGIPPGMYDTDLLEPRSHLQ